MPKKTKSPRSARKAPEVKVKDQREFRRLTGWLPTGATKPAWKT